MDEHEIEKKINVREVVYIMVTAFYKHWNGIKDSFFFIKSIEGLVFNFPKEPVVTLFVKRYSYHKPDDGWIGKSFDFKWGWNYNHTEKIVSFKVTELQPVSIPQEFKDYKVGWYINKNNPVADLPFQPKFIKDMYYEDGWQLFEVYCHYLLKLIGISTLHAVPLTGANKGKADGHFIFNQLYVLYDVTCDEEIERKKKQIAKYIPCVKEFTTVNIGQRRCDLTGLEKQIWIITQKDLGNSLYYKDDLVTVKEVPFFLLVEIYYKRLHEEITEIDLYNWLKNINDISLPS